MHLSKYIKIFPYQEKPGHLLLYSTKKASTLLIRESLLRSIEDERLSPSSVETLSKLGFLVRDLNEEREHILTIFDEYNKNTKRFDIMAVLNLDCNLSCKYCYENTLKGRHYMSSSTADSLIDYIKRELFSQGKTVSIVFYGGEPLLSFEVLTYVSESLKKAAEEEDLMFSFSIVTNGTLLEGKKAEKLAHLGLENVKVTIDGPREIHNHYRPFKSGLGTFDIIIRNIKEISDFTSVSIGGNFTHDTYRWFPQLLDYLLKEGITPDRVSTVKFDPAAKTEGGQGLPDFKEGCVNINEPWLFEASIFLREEILKRGYYTLKIMPASCMVELKDYIVVNYDGVIFKCPGFLGQKDFEVGDLKTGIKDYRKSYQLDWWKKEECLDCTYLPLCFGGCRYIKLLRNGKIDGVDCRKTYLDATLDAFIRQEIKYKLRLS